MSCPFCGESKTLFVVGACDAITGCHDCGYRVSTKTWNALQSRLEPQKARIRELEAEIQLSEVNGMVKDARIKELEELAKSNLGHELTANSFMKHNEELIEKLRGVQARIRELEEALPDPDRLKELADFADDAYINPDYLREAAKRIERVMKKEN